MARKLFIFEDDKYDQFFPLTLSRPIYELLCGARRIRDRISSALPSDEVILLCRKHLAGVLRDATGEKVNQFEVAKEDEVFLVNGRLIPSLDSPGTLNSIKENTLYVNEGEIVAWRGSGKAFGDLISRFDRLYHKDQIGQLESEFECVAIQVELAGYLWNLVNRNAIEIQADFDRMRPDLNFKNMFRHCEVDDQALIYDVDRVYVKKGARVDGQVVLDARSGPIIIDERVHIQPHSRIEGPCYVGRDSIVVGGKIRSGTTIGPSCRIGGEVEQCIFLGYSNKYHEGFLGHSYVGEWVNLGALTTNSDLKNNYGPVKVMVGRDLVNSGQMKVGAFIGDHVKTGIGTLLNTGISIGFASNLFGGEMIKEKYISSFFWGGVGGGETYRLDKAIETAGAVMRRRGREMSQTEADLFKKLFELTERERKS